MTSAPEPSDARDTPRSAALERVDPSPVLTVHPRVEPEAGRWVVYLDVVLVPDRPDHVQTRRIGDYDSVARARLVASHIARTAHRTAPSSLGF